MIAGLYLRNLEIWHIECSDGPRHLGLIVTQPLVAQRMLNARRCQAL